MCTATNRRGVGVSYGRENPTKLNARRMLFALMRLALLCAPSCAVVLAQEPAAPPTEAPAIPVPLPTNEQAQMNPRANCVEPAPMLRWQDYQGPFSKTVGTFAGRLERKSVHPPAYKPGVLLCSFTPKKKFVLFVQDSIDPATFLTAAFNALLDGAEDSDPSFGHDAAGYGKRFGAELADQTSSDSSRILPIRQYFPRIPAITAWGRAAREKDCRTRSSMWSSRIRKMGRTCSIFQSGWERPAP